MVLKAADIADIFGQAIVAYHAQDLLDPVCPQLEGANAWTQFLFEKCWIDTVQWHLEDEIRRPNLEGSAVLALKRRIDALNQSRTNAVEAMDVRLQGFLQPVSTETASELRTESLGWALDRLCILQLKLYHMEIEATREGGPASAVSRLEVLQQQNQQLAGAVDQFIKDIQAGKVRYQPYAQHKLYNDPDTNPALYGVS
ncbi:MAG TPA: hypothetical protein DCE58_05255 [Cryomorphaceae bacterium]|nr:hypothetical protein [Cryomorphaceae bacterium]